MKSTLILAQSGCLLPFLIIFNLVFGWLYLKPHVWLGLEAVLILLFLLTSLILTKKVISSVKSGKRSNAIDIDAEVINEPDNHHAKLE